MTCMLMFKGARMLGDLHANASKHIDIELPISGICNLFGRY